MIGRRNPVNFDESRGHSENVFKRFELNRETGDRLQAKIDLNILYILHFTLIYSLYIHIRQSTRHHTSEQYDAIL
jgi:hypothetical protein